MQQPREHICDKIFKITRSASTGKSENDTDDILKKKKDKTEIMNEKEKWKSEFCAWTFAKKTEQFQFDSMNEESEYELLMTFERGNFVHEREWNSNLIQIMRVMRKIRSSNCEEMN